VTTTLVNNSRNGTQEQNITIGIEELTGLGVSISNAFGLILLVGLLGYAIVSFPRWLWHQGNLDRALRHAQFQAVSFHDDIMNAINDLTSKLTIVKTLNNIVSDENRLRPLVDKIIQTASPVIDKYPVSASNSQSIPIDFKRSYLVYIHRELKAAMNNVERTQYRFIHLQEHAKFIKSVIASRTHPPSGTLRNRIIWLFTAHIKWFIYRLVAIMFIPLILFICYHQFIPLFQQVIPDKNISALSIMVRAMEDYRFLVQVSTLMLSVILSLLVIYGLFNINVRGFYQLIPHHSAPADILFAAVWMCRIVPALCNNVMQMLAVTESDETAFYDVMGLIKLQGLSFLGTIGYLFSNYFPITLIIVAVLNMFHISERIGSCCFGVKRYSRNDIETIDKGENLLNRGVHQETYEETIELEDSLAISMPDEAEINKM
jgi:hypothetical protein